ncbi:GxxExxY protein [Thiohalophilus thiocyanatoxydans]|uniref:GxxExxY protein n=2 Tax=Thiohalophilus thiocyanatoxydans TaxID=381308 RepID=A0A4R8J1P4_9GAMM|nr:GxxExxY protein [Thiohalophilus thiocyanatoxydans]
MLRKESSFGNEIEEMAEHVVDSVYKIHRSLGPGLLESAYEACLKHELIKRGIDVSCQIEMPIIYEGKKIMPGFRMDMLVGQSIIVELKSVEQLLPVHKAQLMTYMKLSKKNLGFLLNFNVPVMKQGISRVVI